MNVYQRRGAIFFTSLVFLCRSAAGLHCRLLYGIELARRRRQLVNLITCDRAGSTITHFQYCGNITSSAPQHHYASMLRQQCPTDETRSTCRNLRECDFRCVLRSHYIFDSKTRLP